MSRPRLSQSALEREGRRALREQVRRQEREAAKTRSAGDSPSRGIDSRPDASAASAAPPRPADYSPAGVTRPSDASITLALVLADDKLGAIETTLRKTFATFDWDEGGVPISVDHNGNCPAYWNRKRAGRKHVCACGYDELFTALRDAVREMKDVRDTVARCIGRSR